MLVVLCNNLTEKRVVSRKQITYAYVKMLTYSRSNTLKHLLGRKRKHTHMCVKAVDSTDLLVVRHRWWTFFRVVIEGGWW